MDIVVDTNIIISALLKDSKIREIIVSSKDKLLVPEITFQEIEDHKNELIEKSELSEEEFNILILKLKEYLTIVPNEKLVIYWKEAESIIGNIDEDDIFIIASSLANNNCPIWSNDKHFQMQSTIRIFNTEEMIKRISEEING